MSDYVWKAPSGGWVDAWNGWYPTEKAARADGSRGWGRTRVLSFGEDCVTDEEAQRRLDLFQGTEDGEK